MASSYRIGTCPKCKDDGVVIDPESGMCISCYSPARRNAREHGNQKVQCGVTLPRSVVNRLDALAIVNGTNRSAVIRDILATTEKFVGTKFSKDRPYGAYGK